MRNRKLFLFIIAIITFMASGASAVQFSSTYRASINPINYYYSHSGFEVCIMTIGAVIDEDGYNVYVKNIPSAPGDLKLFALSGWDNFYPYTHAAQLRPSSGYPWPGIEYEGIAYTFYIDENGNQSLDSGEPEDTFTLSAGSIEILGFVQNVTVSGGIHPTITWDPVDQDGNEIEYRIRMYPVDESNYAIRSELLFQSEFVQPNASDSFSYTYPGDLFESGETLAIAVEAFETNDNRKVRTSAAHYNWSGVCECDLNSDFRCDMQDWLLFGQDWGRTDCGTPPGSGSLPNDCECDLNTDGRCDMQDWLFFGTDWGRTDCP